MKKYQQQLLDIIKTKGYDCPIPEDEPCSECVVNLSVNCTDPPQLLKFANDRKHYLILNDLL